MPSSRALNVTGEAALQLLRLTAASADAFPPLKSVASGTLHIVEIFKKFRSNKSKWEELGVYLQINTATIIKSYSHLNAAQTDFRAQLEGLESTLDQLANDVQSELSSSTNKRFWKFVKDPDTIADIRKRLDDALSVFYLNTSIHTHINTDNTLSEATASNRMISTLAHNTSTIMAETGNISNKASQISVDIVLERLQRIQGASWDQYRTCLPGTRTAIMDEIKNWISQTDSAGNGYGEPEPKGAKILVLTAAAGVGKSAISHTVAQWCTKNNHLGASFFFEHGVSGRNNPAALFTTIASELSRKDERYAKHLYLAVKSDSSLLYAPLSRQFEELIVKPCQGCFSSSPCVFIIDALDEAWDDDLIRILRDHTSNLPNTFRIFLISRMRLELNSLLQRAHVQSIALDKDAHSNMNDIRLFISHEPSQIAEQRGFGRNWATERFQSHIESRASGLFIWATVFCNYLRECDDPRKELEKLASTSGVCPSSVEIQMDRLYASVLEDHDWDNEEFVAEFQQIMGAAIVAKSPLTVALQRELYQSELVVSDYVLQKLSPLLETTSKEDHASRPIALHRSLQEFLTVRASKTTGHLRFWIDEQQRNSQLTLLCLRIMSRCLNKDVTYLGYLDNENTRTIPKLDGAEISGALWYACRFWTDHILDVDVANYASLEKELEFFMENTAVSWMEITGAKGEFRGMLEVRRWMQSCNVAGNSSTVPAYIANHANACFLLGQRLDYESRSEKALQAVQEAVDMYQQLASVSTVALHQWRVPRSLYNLSIYFSDLGRSQEALQAAQRAVQLYRRLSIDYPIVSRLEFAKSLKNLSNRLHDMGLYEGALTAAEESVTIYRQIATEQASETLTFNLAKSLASLSCSLSDMGKQEEALRALVEALEIYRAPGENLPPSLIPNLVCALTNLTICLSDLGRHEEALIAAEEAVRTCRRPQNGSSITSTSYLAEALVELACSLHKLKRYQDAMVASKRAVEIYRTLVEARPINFTPNLALALTNFSIHLSALDRQIEAIASIQEAVRLNRQLVVDRPEMFRHDLAHSLYNLSLRFSGLGYHERALTNVKEAVVLYRQLPSSYFVTVSSEFENCLRHLSKCSLVMDRREESLSGIH